jgi:hypothetical protein
MKHLKLFEEFKGEQIVNSDDAREVIKKYYTIVDEHGNEWVDFLIDSDEFLKRMKEHDGFIAGNYFDDLDHVMTSISELYNLVPHFYISPFWFSRNESDISENDVYSDTIYIPCMEGLTVKDGEIISGDLEFLNADEMFIVTGKSGNKYIRIWWD